MKAFASLLVSLMLCLCASGAMAYTYTAGDYTYDINDGEVTITSYTGNVTELVVPETLGGYPVMSIGDWAFSYCESLLTVELPDGVTSIGRYAFNECSSLESIDLPNGMTKIEEGTFWGCESLESIDIPERVTSIGDSAFKNCYDLALIDIPDGMRSIGTDVFYGCNELRMILLPDTIETIGAYAFDECSFRSLTIPPSLTSISKPLMGYDSDFTSVVLPKELLEIADDAFPESVTKVYCYKDSAADKWAKDTGRTAVYMDSYNIEKDIELITPENNCFFCLEDYVFEVGMRHLWKKEYGIAPMAPGKTYTLRCESSDPAIVRVDGDMLTFLKNGDVTLTVTVDEYPKISHSREIEVYYPVESFAFPTTVFVDVDIGYKRVEIMDTMPEYAYPYYLVGNKGGFIGPFDEHNVVYCEKYDGIGVKKLRVHPYSHSPASATFWDKEPYRDFKLVAYDEVNSITAAAPSRNLETGETYQPDITVTVDNLPFMNEPAAYTLKSSKTSVVKPTDDGKLEAVAPGTATITATTFAGGKTATFNVTVVKATTLNIPVGTKKIEMEAFMSAAAGSVVILDGCESIGARAFKNCANMRKAEIPNSVKSIAGDAFDGCAEGFVIIAPAGSYAAEYAVAHGYTE